MYIDFDATQNMYSRNVYSSPDHLVPACQWVLQQTAGRNCKEFAIHLDECRHSVFSEAGKTSQPFPKEESAHSG